MREKNISFVVDEWRFVPNEGQIQFQDNVITIDNRLSKLLEYLCQNPGLTHTRDELIEHVWSGSVLTDQVVTQAVFELRKVLKKNSENQESYIVTVPKRGYRFDGEVTVEELAIKKPEQISTSDKTAKSEEVGAAPPLLQSTKKIASEFKFIGVFLLAIIIAQAAFIFNQDTSQQVPPHQANHLSHYEFRYAVLTVSDEVKEKPELYGMVIKFIEHIGFYSNIRVVKSEEHQRLAAVEFKFSTARSSDGTKERLLLQYHNRVSGQTHLNRRYSTNFARFQQTFPAMIDDVLRAMFIEVPEDELAKNVEIFPEDPEAVKALVTATGITYLNEGLDKAVEHFRIARNLAPDNAYALAVAYISEVISIFAKDKMDQEALITHLNQEYSESLSEVLKKGNNPRVCEANAIIALSQGEPNKASQILLSIPYNQQTSLTYLLLAKAEEARGHTGAAKELYLQATQNTSSPLALKLVGPLFFESNLDSLIKELQTVKDDDES